MKELWLFEMSRMGSAGHHRQFSSFIRRARKNLAPTCKSLCCSEPRREQASNWNHTFTANPLLLDRVGQFIVAQDFGDCGLLRRAQR
jgi:hypothetical protein